MKDDNIKIPKWVAVLLAIVGGIMFFQSISNRRRAKDAEKENEILKKQFKELLEVLQKVTNVTEELKLRIELLIQQRDHIPSEIIAELVVILSLINGGHFETAIGHLAKIIENQLRLRYEYAIIKDKAKKRPTFHDYVEWAKSSEVLSKEEVHFTFALKEMRNQAFHQLDVNKDPVLNASSLMIGIGIIIKLNNRPSNLDALKEAIVYTK